MRVKLLQGILGSALLCSALSPQEALGQRSPDEQQRLNEWEQQRRVEAARNEFLSSVGGIRAGRSDAARRREFRNDIQALRGQVVEFWALRFAPMSEAWARKDLDDRSKELSQILKRIREYVDRDSSPPELQPADLRGRSFAERLDQFIIVGTRLPGRVLEVTEGAVLDVGLLEDVRSDFASLEAWVREFREGVR